MARIGAAAGGTLTRANLFASFTWENIDTPSINSDIYGVVIQGGVYVAPKIEAYARFEYGHWDFSNPNLSDLWAVTIGANYYIDGHDLKWTTDIGFALDEVSLFWNNRGVGWRADVPGQDDQMVLRSQLQLAF